MKQPKTEKSSLKQQGRKNSLSREEWGRGRGPVGSGRVEGGGEGSLVTQSPVANNNGEAKEDAGKQFPGQAIAVTGTFKRK